MLKGKKIVLGVTGSIAAYKAVFLLRLLVKEGASVKVIMTAQAKDFVAPLSFSTLSHNTVLTEFSTPDGSWENHVALANEADLIIIAPASANTIGKMALGLCDNLLLATVFSSSCPVFIAPAMDREMHSNASIQSNIERLAGQGKYIIPSGKGELASGLIGEGRMAEPEQIVRFIQKAIVKSLPLYGKKALVSAGPTYEAIDPVRFIGNHSSGKMGYAIAEELASKGALVTLVHGPVSISTTHKSIKTIGIESAGEMYNACMKELPGKDIVVMSAAVADYKPKVAAKEKIKKSADTLTLQLEPTRDILAAIGKVKKKKCLLIGFALETENEMAHAQTKLKKKNLDAIVLNSLKDELAGPGGDMNKITIIDRNNKTLAFELKTKKEVATDIVHYIIRNYELGIRN